VTDEDVDEVDQLFSDPSPLHDASGHDEKGDGDEGDGVHLGEGVGEKLAGGIAAAVDAAEEDEPPRRGHEADRNGYADDETEEQNAYGDINHDRPPRKRSFVFWTSSTVK
jgi:hypothetical protein